MIKFLVKGQNIETLEHEIIADNQIAFVKIHFIFDSNWKPLHKVVQFSQDNEIFNQVLGANGSSCLLPSELRAGAVKMSLFGYDTESTETVRATTIFKTLHIRPSGFENENSTPIPPTPDLYHQLLQEIQKYEKGSDGKSAFEIAVEHGFIGTEEQWLESLHGKDGISPDISEYPSKSDIELMIQKNSHKHDNNEILDTLNDEHIALLDNLQQFEDETKYSIQTIKEAVDYCISEIQNLKKQINNISIRNYTILFQYGDDAIEKYADNIGLVLNGGYHLMNEFTALHNNFCNADNSYALNYSTSEFGWDTQILTVFTRKVSLSSKSEIVVNFKSGATETGIFYLIKKPEKLDVPVTIYVKNQIENAIPLEFKWLQSDSYISTITTCDNVPNDIYYIAFIGRSNNTHPIIRELKVSEG